MNERYYSCVHRSTKLDSVIIHSVNNAPVGKEYALTLLVMRMASISQVILFRPDFSET
jgi:hypothetical protein